MENQSGNIVPGRLSDEEMKKKIANAQEVECEDVMLEELRQDWLRTSSAANRHDAPADAKVKAREAKKKYLEALKKKG